MPRVLELHDVASRGAPDTAAPKRGKRQPTHRGQPMMRITGVVRSRHPACCLTARDVLLNPFRGLAIVKLPSGYAETFSQY